MTSVDCSKTYLGNYFNAPNLQRAVELACSENRTIEVQLTQADRQKSRIYAKTNAGEAIGLLKRRDWKLTDGDVFKLEGDRFLLIHLNAQRLMTLSLETGQEIDALKLIHLGHTLGNHHYPIEIAVGKIYIQIDNNAATLESTLKAFDIAGLKIEYEMRSPNQALVFSRHHHY